MAFRWRANNDPIIVVFGFCSSIKKTTNVFKVGPPLTKFSGPAQACNLGSFHIYTETVTAAELHRFVFGRPFTYEPNPWRKSKKMPV